MPFRLYFLFLASWAISHHLGQHQHHCLNHTIRNATLTGLTITISEMKLRRIHKNCVIRQPHRAQTRSSASEDMMLICPQSAPEGAIKCWTDKNLYTAAEQTTGFTLRKVWEDQCYFSHIWSLSSDEMNKYRSSTTRQKERKHTHEQISRISKKFEG